MITATTANPKRAAARLSLGSNLTLFALKLIVGLLSGSVSVLAEAAHSASDLIASALALFSVRMVDLPPDETHPYGHGKAEGITTMGQGVLLSGVAAYIVYEAIHKMLSHDAPPPVGLGIAVMGASAIVNVFVVRVVRRVARETGSQALEAVSVDHLADIYAASGVSVGLLLVHLTGRGSFDSLMALVVAALIFHSAWNLLRDATGLLMDTHLPAEDVATVRRILSEEPAVLGYHKLRTRKAGVTRHIDAHILLDDTMTLAAAHAIAEEVEEAIRKALPNVDVIVHAEPFEEEMRHQKEEHGHLPHELENIAFPAPKDGEL